MDRENDSALEAARDAAYRQVREAVSHSGLVKAGVTSTDRATADMTARDLRQEYEGADVWTEILDQPHDQDRVTLYYTVLRK